MRSLILSHPLRHALLDGYAFCQFPCPNPLSLAQVVLEHAASLFQHPDNLPPHQATNVLIPDEPVLEQKCPIPPQWKTVNDSHFPILHSIWSWIGFSQTLKAELTLRHPGLQNAWEG